MILLTLKPRFVLFFYISHIYAPPHHQNQHQHEICSCHTNVHMYQKKLSIGAKAQSFFVLSYKPAIINYS